MIQSPGSCNKQALQTQKSSSSEKLVERKRVHNIFSIHSICTQKFIKLERTSTDFQLFIFILDPKIIKEFWSLFSSCLHYIGEQNGTWRIGGNWSFCPYLFPKAALLLLPYFTSLLLTKYTCCFLLTSLLLIINHFINALEKCYIATPSAALPKMA